MKYEEKESNRRRRATYSSREVKCKNVSTLFHLYGAKPGMMVKYYHELNDGSREYQWGRVLGRVDAPFEKGGSPEYDCPEIKGHIAVAEITWCGHLVVIRWIDPDRVTELYEAPKSLPAWFFQQELPPIEEVLAADRDGSLCEPYIDRWVSSHPRQSSSEE